MMISAPRLDPAEIGGLPALAPFLVRAHVTRASRPPVSTGLAAVDALLDGGFPRGRISEVVGPRTSGRTSLALRSMARATAEGGLVALVDTVDGLDPVSASAAGVALGRLLWVRCGGRVVAAVRAADVIVRGGGFALVLVDLGDLPPWTLARVPAAAFVRLQRAVEATPTALVLAGPRRIAGSLAATALALRPRAVRWIPGGPGLLATLTAEARLVRSRDRAPGAAVPVVWQL